MSEKYVDLHLHTTASDGSFTPKELVKRAVELGFSAIAITDHDTVGALKEGVELAKENGIEMVPGIELNTDYENTEIHILGYYIDFSDEKLVNKLISLQEARYNRIKNIVQKLNEVGIDIDFDNVANLAQDAALGRPHIAQLMLEKGYVKEWSDAFDKYIGKGCPAYVERKKLTPKEAIQLIKGVGGVPILAHPVLMERDDLLPKLIEWGIEGLEVYHTEHDKGDIKRYLEFVRENKLLMTAGSDCHGPKRKKEILMGKIKGPISILEELKSAKK
ncbi:PHP domain-containing protein [Halonatronum saccharophilum]|uniref:PHP domain-containing protein n=1 Tax=Halonatronum saccharophilum TaxID=150060 RepID=UPI000482BC2F|nr:PHP domain-containing protein [Halonatronum saccharophilum]